ncbi:hypothetical protein [Actinomadura madurae]|uniref:hypothetical protein n=1 Tax=Actinomadura madurae TaxID=1993 RepID=UPI0020D25E40|nr:hypothetical protein [Actinomadura madurae]MCQ0015974.1 hypothetical protein [Actinomadura madurae]
MIFTTLAFAPASSQLTRRLAGMRSLPSDPKPVSTHCPAFTGPLGSPPGRSITTTRPPSMRAPAAATATHTSGEGLLGAGTGPGGP